LARRAWVGRCDLGYNSRAAFAARFLPVLGYLAENFVFSPGACEENIEKMRKIYKKTLFNRKKMQYNKMELS
jgi:hypothetical protein